jgi:hypothetical protein
MRGRMGWDVEAYCFADNAWRDGCDGVFGIRENGTLRCIGLDGIWCIINACICWKQYTTTVSPHCGLQRFESASVGLADK